MGESIAPLTWGTERQLLHILLDPARAGPPQASWSLPRKLQGPPPSPAPRNPASHPLSCLFLLALSPGTWLPGMSLHPERVWAPRIHQATPVDTT